MRPDCFKLEVDAISFGTDNHRKAIFRAFQQVIGFNRLDEKCDRGPSDRDIPAIL